MKTSKNKLIAGLALGGLIGSLATGQLLWAICFSILLVEAICGDFEGRS